MSTDQDKESGPVDRDTVVDQANAVDRINSFFDLEDDFLAASLANQAILAKIEQREAELLSELRNGSLTVTVEEFNVDETALSSAIDEYFDEISHVGDSTIENGEMNAAEVYLGDVTRHVDVFFRADGANSQMTVEVSTDGAEWHQFDTQTHSDSSEIYQYDAAWRYIRAYTDQNIGKIEISSKGM